MNVRFSGVPRFHFVFILAFSIFLLFSCPFQNREEARILSFSLDKRNGVIDHEQGRILVSLDRDSDFDLGNLVPEFVYTGNSVRVGTEIQKSGLTPQDFSSDPVYTVSSSSEEKQYRVSVYRSGRFSMLFSENFNEETNGLGMFRQYSIKGNTEWKWSKKGGSATYVIITGFYEKAANDDWLILAEALDLSRVSDAYIEFDTAMNYAVPTRGLSLYVSSEYPGNGDPVPYNWTDLSSSVSWASPGWIWTSSGNVSLSGFVGQKIYIAFRYQCTASAADTWEIDSFKVFTAK